MGIFDGMELTIETGISLGRKALVRKLPLGERIEFMIAYDSWLLTGGRKAESELVGRVLAKPKRALTGGDRQKILKTAIALNSDGDRKPDGKPADPDRLAKLTAYFGREFGFSKRETMGLFPEEIDALVRENERLKIKEWTLLAGIIHLPADTVRMIGRGDLENTDLPLDRNAVDNLKKAQRRDVCP